MRCRLMVICPPSAEEVRITLLHELGHYLGLNEEQVAALRLA